MALVIIILGYLICVGIAYKMFNNDVLGEAGFKAFEENFRKYFPMATEEGVIEYYNKTIKRLIIMGPITIIIALVILIKTFITYKGE